jgi:hypothetical protein
MKKGILINSDVTPSQTQNPASIPLRITMLMSTFDDMLKKRMGALPPTPSSAQSSGDIRKAPEPPPAADPQREGSRRGGKANSSSQLSMSYIACPFCEQSVPATTEACPNCSQAYPLSAAIKYLQEDIASQNFIAAMKKLRALVTGLSLADAKFGVERLATYRGLFPDSIDELMRFTQRSGNISDGIERGADTQRVAGASHASKVRTPHPNVVDKSGASETQKAVTVDVRLDGLYINNIKFRLPAHINDFTSIFGDATDVWNGETVPAFRVIGKGISLLSETWKTQINCIHLDLAHPETISYSSRPDANDNGCFDQRLIINGMEISASTSIYAIAQRGGVADWRWKSIRESGQRWLTICPDDRRLSVEAWSTDKGTGWVQIKRKPWILSSLLGETLLQPLGRFIRLKPH